MFRVFLLSDHMLLKLQEKMLCDKINREAAGGKRDIQR